MVKAKKQKHGKRKNSKPASGARLDDSMIFKVQRGKKAALIRYAQMQDRSYGYFLQKMLDAFLLDQRLEPLNNDEADAILGAAMK